MSVVDRYVSTRMLPSASGWNHSAAPHTYVLAYDYDQLAADNKRLREAELLLLSVCNDLMRHENADVRMVTCIELNNWLTRRAAMDAKDGEVSYVD